jgi:hypothetical protein
MQNARINLMMHAHPELVLKAALEAEKRGRPQPRDDYVPPPKK